MTRDDIVKIFIEVSGRFDLVKDANAGDYTTNGPIGVDFFINAGARWLENRVSRKKEFVWEKYDIAIGDVIKVITNLKSVKEVWMMNADGRFLLTKKSLGWIRQEFAKAAADVTQDKPKYWTPAAVGFSQNQLDLTAVGGTKPYTSVFTYDIDDLVFGDHFNQSAILWMPPSDAIYTLSILGQFYERSLTNSTDTNFWSVRYHEALIQAAMLMMERFYRNREGYREHREYIQDDLINIQREPIEEEISGKNQMTG